MTVAGEHADVVFAADGDGGRVALRRTAPRAAELYVTGDDPAALVRAAEGWCAANGIEYLHTLQADPLLEELGFVPLEPPRLVKRVERGFSVFPLPGIPELREGDDLAALVLERAELQDGDVVVVAQKAISKVEGRVVRLDDVEPSARAREIAGDEGDPRRVEWILREAARVVRVRAPLVICETRHGFICASAGVDQSNTPEDGTLVLLPLDPDGSADRLRATLRERSGRDVGVLVTDSFGRPWRQGTTDVAIGAAGITVLQELTGEHDPIGYELKATVIALADELAGAAQLVSGKLDRNPVTIVRGLDVRGDGRATDIPIPPERDLFG
ncbi:MAG TPA: coenzyme F420-0:L-glutamate ligase [Gaiellaceae bacterium]|nr:coenzyme F420-0:L-glutamate ligase [Gaiellaceae bacterium]